MEHKGRISQYLSGLSDTKAERQTENALLRDAGFLKSFIDAVEQRLYVAPPGFAASVMRRLPNSLAPDAKVPVLSRKLCAAACFCSAAVIMALTTSGVNRHIFEFIQSVKFDEWIAFAQNLISGGK